MPYRDPAAKLANDRAWRAENRAKTRKYKAAYRAKHHEKILAANRLYHAAHAEQESAYGRAYRLNHPEKERQRGRNYRLRNPDKAKARKKRYRAKPSTKTKELQAKIAYRAAHKAEILAYARAYALTHRQERTNNEQRRRARMLHAPLNDFTHQQWHDLQIAQDHRCAYCHKRFKWRLTRDHITPLAKGGSHTLHNMIGACSHCNREKYTGPPLKPVQPLLL